MGWFSGKPRSFDWASWFAEQVAAGRDQAVRDFYDTGVVSPDTPIKSVPLVAMDMETTGLDHRKHAIVSIGLIPFTLRRIYFRDRRYHVVKPPRPLEEKSITFHRITHGEIAGAPDINKVLDPILALMAGRIPVVHYRGIERPFLNAAVHARRGEELLFPLIDTMELEARLHRESLSARLLRGLGRAPLSIRLHDSRARYGLPVYQAHHALTDALATAELLQAQIARHYSAETPLRQLWV